LDDGFIKEEECKEGMGLIDTTVALLNGYIKYLSKRKQTTVTSNE
jgi:hypothetical protein